MQKNKKLWNKGSTINTAIEKYLAGDDIEIDQKLVKYDVQGSLAHSQMLYQKKLITKKNFEEITKGLKTILKLNNQGTFKIELDDEDVHTKIENFLSKHYPQSGGTLHTGRSRNDQILVDIRMYTKDELDTIMSSLVALTNKFIHFAQQYECMPMVGYTHMQPAMLSSVGLWASSFAESLLDDLVVLEAAYTLNNQSPLGSGAAYGVTLPLDRELTAHLLEFNKVQINSLYCQNSKGKIESTVIHALNSVMQTFSKFAQDMLLFTTDEFNYFSVPNSLTTGSSIMPQKNNHDAMELLRGKAKIVRAHYSLVASINSDLPSGYNRDTQLIKKPLFESLKITRESIEIVDIYISAIKPNNENIRKNISKELFAAHYAYQLMKDNNWPFREAYFYVSKNIEKIPSYDPEIILKETMTLGGPGNLQINQLKKRHRYYLKKYQKLNK